MNPSQRIAQRQQRRVRREAETADSLSMFNVLTGPRLLEAVEGHLPAHRERLYPPTTTLAMFVAQALSADGSCREAVDAAMTNRLIAGLTMGSAGTGGATADRADRASACRSIVYPGWRELWGWPLRRMRRMPGGGAGGRCAWSMGRS